MVPVKVVLMRGDREIELGPFNQGVVLEHRSILDVSTSEVIASKRFGHEWWTDDGDWFDRAFIQSAEEDRDGS